MKRSQSQLSVELRILKIKPVSLVRFSTFKDLQKAGTEIYSFLVKYKNFEYLEFQKKSVKVTCLSLYLIKADPLIHYLTF